MFPDSYGDPIMKSFRSSVMIPSGDIRATEIEMDYLLSAQAVRERSWQIYYLVSKGQGRFKINKDRLNDLADYVVSVIHEKYPKI